jgi:hypothetical protein
MAPGGGGCQSKPARKMLWIKIKGGERVFMDAKYPVPQPQAKRYVNGAWSAD